MYIVVAVLSGGVYLKCLGFGPLERLTQVTSVLTEFVLLGMVQK